MLTRRTFVAQLAAAAAAVGAVVAVRGAVRGAVRSAARAAGASASTRATRRPVVSFHMDRPYIDRTGTAMPYDPPRGARSAEPAACLSEEAFRRMQCYA
ncbi:MAG TPA: hypothetical protein VHX36_10215 [Candidatus Acidoferrales bacterium]|jgi:hypothetical protein|nr:hypothetical protein [Candidatus Acidoferrales bacterium]